MCSLLLFVGVMDVWDCVATDCCEALGVSFSLLAIWPWCFFPFLKKSMSNLATTVVPAGLRESESHPSLPPPSRIQQRCSANDGSATGSPPRLLGFSITKTRSKHPPPPTPPSKSTHEVWAFESTFVNILNIDNGLCTDMTMVILRRF